MVRIGDYRAAAMQYIGYCETIKMFQPNGHSHLLETQCNASSLKRSPCHDREPANKSSASKGNCTLLYRRGDQIPITQLSRGSNFSITLLLLCRLETRPR